MKAWGMKKTTAGLAILLLFWGGCQSLPQVMNPRFEEFKIQKLSTSGIETVTVHFNSLNWPEVQFYKVAPLNVNSKNLNIAVIGDTGCRLKESNGKGVYQNCSVTKEWAYPEVAKSLQGETYDFAVHTGDYHYREQCSDPKLCSLYAQHTGYGWAAWWDDFFAPSLPLFKKSPWLFVRGNHEDCKRAYQGWSILSSVVKRIQDSCEEIENYQWIEMDDLVFINFDNSAFEDRQELTPKDSVKWKEQFLKITQQIKQLKTKKEIWFLVHKPVLGFVPSPADAEPVAVKPNMMQLLKQTGLYDQIDIFLSGHIHNQQLVPDDNKLQLIVGHGGSALDPFGRKIFTEQLVTTTENKYSFGYALFHRSGFKKWDFTFKNQFGEVELKCHLDKNKASCD